MYTEILKRPPYITILQKLTEGFLKPVGPISRWCASRRYRYNTFVDTLAFLSNFCSVPWVIFLNKCRKPFWKRHPERFRNGLKAAIWRFFFYFFFVLEELLQLSVEDLSGWVTMCGRQRYKTAKYVKSSNESKHSTGNSLTNSFKQFSIDSLGSFLQEFV